MSESRPNQLARREPIEIADVIRADIALRDLPIEEPFPPAFPGWKTYASSCHVNALAAAPEELWAATWGGVVCWRFRGPKVTYTRFASEHGLLGTHLGCIAVDARGCPWVGGPGVGLSTFDGERWQTFTVADGLHSDSVLCVASGADGRVWAGTDRGIGHVEANDDDPRWWNHPLDSANVPANRVQALIVDSNGTLWLGTEWGLYRLDPDGVSKRYTVRDGLSSLQVTGLALGDDGRLWIGTVEGLCCLDENGIKPCQDLDEPILGLTIEPGSSLIWVVTSDGIGAYTPEGLDPVDPHSALADKAEGRAVAVGPSGRWFGYTKGIAQQIASRVLSSDDDVDQMTKGENSLCNCVTAVRVDAIGRLWVGTPEGLWYVEHTVWHQCQPEIELATPLANVQAIASSPATQRLWVGGWRVDGSTYGEGSGLRQFIGTTEVPLIGEMPELPYIDTLTCDRQGRLWVAAEGIIYCFDGDKWEELPPLPDAAQAEVILCLAVDKRGTLWCGTTGGLWHRDSRWSRQDTDGSVQALACKGSQVWVGTSVGLKRLSGRRRRRWTDVEGLADANVTSLAVSSDGVLWAGTTDGLIRIVEGDHRVLTAKNSGLACDYVQALAWNSNTLWIGTANGLSRFTTSAS